VPAAEETAQGGASSSDLVWLKDRYRDALDQARREHKLVFVDFTGYACANCHWMRANILNRPEIAALLTNYVLLELYTDGEDAASKANSQMQVDKFGTVNLPFYVILDPDEKLVDKFEGLVRDAASYRSWLSKVALPETPATAAPAAAAASIDLPGVKRLDGTPLDAAALNGKVVVVNFWATYCIPCIGELPAFNKVNRDLAAKGVAVIGISMDEAGTPLQPFLKKHPIEYTVGQGGDPVAKKYGLESYPVTLVFDRTGKQIKRYNESLTEADLLATIQKAM